MKTAVFAESMREQPVASPHNSSLWGRDSKSPGATLGSSNLPPGTNNLAAVERHRSRIYSRKSFRKTWLSAGLTDGPLNTPHTRMKPRNALAGRLIRRALECSGTAYVGDGSFAGYEAGKDRTDMPEVPTSPATAVETHPVQAGSRGNRVQGACPKTVTMAAYEVYRHIYGPQEALVTNGCRGGFATSELVAFLYARAFPKDQWGARVDEAFRGMQDI
jgi:hypothetical protein